MDLDPEKIFERFVQAAGVRVHYGEAGAGHPVICLHGTGPGANAWANFRPNAGALAERFRTLLVDLPRFGRSEKVVVKAPRLDYLSGVIRGLMDGLGIERAHFVGNSMGAQVAIKLAIDTPARVGRMVLVAPAPIAHSVFAPMPTETVRMIAEYYGGEGPSLEKMRLLMRSLVYDPASLSEALIRERHQASIDPEVLAVNKGPHWAHQSLEHELDKARGPVLLVWGQDDRASPLDHGLVMLRKMPQARLHVFARCGHSVQLEHPAEFNRLAVDFLTDRAGGA
jgi:pimeloyl-ACP methyl ester carboxylesterase